ncbi:MAG: ribosome biogenesis GTPase Der [Omnitrophica bacterium]|nr:ribosome biogenesis GTPase Der [Candidatus Omnitrophota bacterium]
MRNNTVPTVSIVGRPNVGKSSLFNRIAGKRVAVVFEEEGTTRDRNEHCVKIGDKNLNLVDTGGFPARGAGEIEALIKKQIEKAVASSDVLLFVSDGESGLLPLDLDLAEVLRKSGKKVILVVNKVDNEKREENLTDFYELGLGDVFAISCLHNMGLKKLILRIKESVPDHAADAVEKRRPIKIAIVGRPNVGKSSFLNKVLDEERALVHEKPGTTRDSIDSYFEKDGILFLLIDTAGMRHKRKVKKAVDAYSMMRSKGAIADSDVALLLIDGLEGVTGDDVKIFEYIRKEGKGCAIIVNKWDLVKGIETSRYVRAILRRIPDAKKFPIAFISAKTGKRALEAFNLTLAIKTNLDLFINAATLKMFLKQANPAGVSISHRKKIPKFFYMTQANVFPKEFFVFVNNTEIVTHAHTAFIENRLREEFPLSGVPIRIKYRRLGRKRSG